jgi:CDP-diglyceride synthetase
MLAQLALVVSGLFALGATMMAVSHRVRHNERSRSQEDWIKYGIYAAIIVTFLLAAYFSRWIVAGVLLVITVVGSGELKHACRCKYTNPLLIAVPAGLLIKCSLGHLLLAPHGDWFGWFGFVFLLVSISDSFAQLWGRLLGRHKLCSRLSPGKTIEGFVGGILTTMAGALVMSPLLGEVTSAQALTLGLTIAIAAPIGDLSFSLIKRTLAIKDFSGLIPGHGGVFDRFDSLVVAAPVAYWCARAIGI